MTSGQRTVDSDGRNFALGLVSHCPLSAVLYSLALALIAAACAPLAANEPRAAKSSLSCMRAAILDRNFGGASDAEIHCIAAGLIARRCSVGESMLAGIGKEIQDMFGSGDAEWRDLRADRRGIRCARSAGNEAALSSCCYKAEAVSG